MVFVAGTFHTERRRSSSRLASGQGCGPHGAACNSLTSWVTTSGRNSAANPSTKSFVVHDQDTDAHDAASAAATRRARGKRTVNSVNSPTRLSTSMVPPYSDRDVVANREAEAGALAGRLGSTGSSDRWRCAMYQNLSPSDCDDHFNTRRTIRCRRSGEVIAMCMFWMLPPPVRGRGRTGGQDGCGMPRKQAAAIRHRHRTRMPLPASTSSRAASSPRYSERSPTRPFDLNTRFKRVGAVAGDLDDFGNPSGVEAAKTGSRLDVLKGEHVRVCRIGDK